MAREAVGVDRQNLHRRHPLRGAVSWEELALPYVKNGHRVIPPEPLADVRDRAKRQIAASPVEMKRLRNPEIYPVLPSPRLAKVKAELIKAFPRE